MKRGGKKFYVVWQGRRPGVYASWAECEAQVKGFPEARFRAFPTRRMAEAAFRQPPEAWLGREAALQPWLLVPNPPQVPCLCVDAACPSSPGPVEYRGVRLPEGEQVFRQGPFPEGTNNIGEFLAIVHALAWLHQRGLEWPVYTDSVTARAWVRAGKCRTTLQRTVRNEPLFELIARAETWLAEHEPGNPLHKWDTQAWGEIPADFGRK